jgi:hypothetical protein
MNNNQLEHIKVFLNKCKIVCSELSDLNGITIPREIFLDKELYLSVKDEIPILKQIFTSSALTGLQSNAEENQKWPLLNLVRQVLRSCNYKMTPKRISAGYTKDGKKIYKRMFIIEKISVLLLNSTSHTNSTVVNDSDEPVSSDGNSSTLGDSSSNVILSGSTSLN